jgi:hypothetical protein
VVFAWAASVLGTYPLVERLMLFLLPAAILITSYGVATLWEYTRGYAQWILAAAIILLLSQSILLPWVRGFPQYRDEIKPALKYIEDHYMPEDQVYVYRMARFAFMFYASDRLKSNSIIGRGSGGNPVTYKQDMKHICGHSRVWLLFSADIYAVRPIIAGYLDQIGERRDRILSQGSAAYLYDLSKVDCSEY